MLQFSEQQAAREKRGDQTRKNAPPQKNTSQDMDPRKGKVTQKDKNKKRAI